MESVIDALVPMNDQKKKPFRIVAIHPLHVTEQFLDDLKERFTFNYSPITIQILNCQVYVTDTNEIVLCSNETKEVIRRIPSTHKYSVHRLTSWESSETKKGQIVSLSSDSLKARDLDGKGVRIFPGHNGRMTCMEITKDELYEDVRLISGSSKGLILIHMFKSAKILYTLDRHVSSISSLCLTVGIRGIELIASIDKQQNLRLWELETGELIREFVA